MDGSMATTNSNFRKNHGRIYKCGKSVTTSTTLLNYLRTVTSRSFGEPAWRRRILRCEIFVDEAIVTDIDHPLTPGCRVFYHRPPWNEPTAVLVEGDSDMDLPSSTSDPDYLKILYQDEHLMAVHKPSGLPTMHSQTFVEYTVLHVLRTTALSNPDPNPYPNSTTIITNTSDEYLAPPQPVHRLGVGTSGVLLIATSLPARKALSRAIRERRVKKVYRALVQGADIPDSLRIDCPIGPVPFPIGGGTIYAACPPNASSAAEMSDEWDDDETNTEGGRGLKEEDTTTTGKTALSLVRVVRRNVETDEAVVDVEIPTGRPHQIRIHMAYSGHPLVGDPLFQAGGLPNREPRLFPKRNKADEDMDTDNDEDEEGGEEGVMRVPLPRDCGYSLHAHQITVEHPTIEGKWMTFTAKPPANLM